MMMNPEIEKKLLLIRDKAEALEMLTKKCEDPIHPLAIDIKILVQNIFIEINVQNQLDLQKKGKKKNDNSN